LGSIAVVATIGTPIRALIADDDVPTRVGLRTILSSDPEIEVVGEAATGTDAVELVRLLDPDVALMDVQLPDIDGIAATRLITDARNDRAGRTRVIVLTTFDFDEYVYESIRAGASGFLLKRTRAEDIIEAVRTVANGNSLPQREKTRELIAGFAKQAIGRRVSNSPHGLTNRESEVLTLIARGLSNDEIATALGVSLETVRTHVKHVYMKCGSRDRVHAVITAYEAGLVAPSDQSVL
jgi:DNA-binding NarL/FixJ family response regulator